MSDRGTLLKRSAAKAALRSKVEGIVTEDAVSAFIELVESEAERLADTIAARHAAEARARRTAGLRYTPRLERRHAKDITAKAHDEPAAEGSLRREVNAKHGTEIEVV